MDSTDGKNRLVFCRINRATQFGWWSPNYPEVIMKKFCLSIFVTILIVTPYFLQAQQDSLFLLDSTRILGPAFSIQRRMEIAFNGSIDLVIWSDAREYTLVNPAELYGARIQKNNFLLLDSLGLKLSETAGISGFLACASDSTNFLVVTQELEAQIFDSTGNPVCASFQISSHNGASTLISATFGGGSYFVVWQDLPYSQGNIYGARISPAGTVLDTNAILINTGYTDQFFPSTCSGPGCYLVAWRRGNNQRKIYASRVAYDGTLIDTNEILIASSSPDREKPQVAFGDSLWLIVFEAGTLCGGIFAVRLDINGNVLDPNPIVISNNITAEWCASVSYDGNNFGVFYSDGYGNLWLNFVNKDGQISPPILVSPLNYAFISTSIFDGTNYIVVYENTWDVYAAQVRPDGSVIQSDFLVTHSAYGQEKSRTGYGGTDYLAVWQDQRNSAWYPNVFGARIKRDGTVLDPQGIRIALGQKWLSLPDVCSNGTNYLVAWQEGRPSYEQLDVRASRVSTDGAILDDIPIATSSGWNEKLPALASDGDKYLVTFTSDEGNFLIYDIMGILVNADGSIVPREDFQSRPTVINIIIQPRHSVMVNLYISAAGGMQGVPVHIVGPISMELGFRPQVRCLITEVFRLLSPRIPSVVFMVNEQKLVLTAQIS